MHHLELEVVVFVLKIWSQYLFGSRFEVFIDHKSLKYTFYQKELNMRQKRCLEFLNNYDFGLSFPARLGLLWGKCQVRLFFVLFSFFR